MIRLCRGSLMICCWATSTGLNHPIHHFFLTDSICIKTLLYICTCDRCTLASFSCQIMYSENILMLKPICSRTRLSVCFLLLSFYGSVMADYLSQYERVYQEKQQTGHPDESKTVPALELQVISRR